MDEGAGRRRRRSYSAEFKAEAIAAGRRPGASLAAAALEPSINANLLRRWVVEAERGEAGTPASVALAAPLPNDRFVPVPMAPKVTHGAPVKVEVRRGNLTVSVQWPRSAMHECAVWLREVLK
jgi:transposase